MALEFGCSYCGWIGSRKQVVRAACPECGHPVHDRWTLWSEWRWFVGLGLVAAALVGYSFLPQSARLYLDMAISEHGPDQEQYIHLDSLSVQPTPRGSQLAFRIRNATQLTFSKLRLSLTVHPFPAADQQQVFGRSLPDLVVADLDPGAERVVTAEVESLAPQQLMGWQANVAGIELPDGFWNRELEKIVTVRIFGVFGDVPIPFGGPAPGPVLHGPLGQKMQLR